MFYIFDWDGTISDSADRIVQCMQEASDEVGLPSLEDDEIKNIIGLAMREAVLTLYPELDDEKIIELRDVYARIYKRLDAVPSEFFPGVMETLNTLKNDNNIIAVATGKGRRGMSRILTDLGLTDYFHFSRCADETASKPHPKMLNELLQAANVDVSQAVMIGDTEWDMRMAQNAGMQKIAVDYGAHSVERLQACEPELLISDFSDILKWRF